MDDDSEAMKMRVAEARVKLEDEKRELERLKTRLLEVRQQKVSTERDLAAQEQQRHTRIMLLIDAISKFKESIDVCLFFDCNG